ncbi:MAG: hypothetical protein K8I82_21130, partial [Anaerolineae bacterium]|nr:hypothetical protein [Anaerolineae bacterium]
MVHNYQEYIHSLSGSKVDQTLRDPRTLVAVGIRDTDEVYLRYLRDIGYITDFLPSIKGLYNSILANIPNVLLLDIDNLGKDAVTITRSLKDNPLTYT